MANKSVDESPYSTTFEYSEEKSTSSLGGNPYHDDNVSISDKKNNESVDESPYSTNFEYNEGKSTSSLKKNPYHDDNVFISYKKKEGFILNNLPIEALDIGGYFQVDGRLFLGEDQPKSTFLIRRARLYSTGELYEMFRFLVMPEWDNQNKVGLAYCWLETMDPSWGRVRVGLFKKPFSLEALKSPLFRNFDETSMIVKNYCRVSDVGVAGFGELDSDLIAYSLGFFNGTLPTQLDNNNNKEMVGRIVFKIISSKTFGRVCLGFSGATGRFDEDISGTEFVTGTFNAFWIWSDNPNKPVENHASRKRWGMDIEWFAGPFYFCAEYLHTNWGKIRMGNRHAIFHGCGGYAECSYLLTGEDKPRNGPVFPKHNFDPCKHHWGAWEIAFRYEIFFATKKMIHLRFAKGANFLHSPSIAVNWYINPRVALKIDGQYFWFNHPLITHSKKFSQQVDIVARLQAVF